MAAEKRHLRHAPIIEALIDLRVPPAAELPPDIQAILRDRVPAEFAMETLGMSETHLEVVKGVPSVGQTRQVTRGYVFKSNDGARLAQFRLDGFTFNRLRPYVSFEEMRDQALDLWRVYVDAFNPSRVTRVAVRYINHLRLPAPVGDLARFLTAPPTPPPGLREGHVIAGFLARVSVINPQTGISAHVTHALDQSLQPGEAVILLDIDVYTAVEYEPHDARLQGILEKLRDMKNITFFESVTEEATALWQ